MMSKRLLHSPPLVALLAAGSLVIVACSAASDPEVGSPLTHHTGSTSTSGSGESTGGGSSSTGSSASTGTTGSTNGASSTGTSSGSTGSTGTSSGSTGSTGTTDTGDDAGAASPTAPASPSFEVALDNAAPSMDLADEAVVNVTVTSQKNWAGAVTLSTATLPTDVTGSFDNATVNLTAGGSATAKLTLKSLSTTVAAATPFTVAGTVGSVAMSAPATITVKSILTIDIPVNVDTLKPGFGTVTITAPADIATNPVTILFKNLDSTPHEIHAENPKQGLAHGTGTFSEGQTDTPRMMIATGTFDWHLHDEPNTNGPDNPGVIIIK